MSWRKSKSPWGSRRRRAWLPSEDDLPLSLLSLLNAHERRRTKKKTPSKKKTQTPRATRRASGASVSVRPAVVATPSAVIDLDEMPEAAEIVNNVNSKIGDFLQSGSFISSDEEETEMIKAKTNKKSSPNLFFISDDSDDDIKIDSTSKNSTSNFNNSEPSTSASDGTNSRAVKENELKVLDDDIMSFVDSVLCCDTNSNKEQDSNPLKDMKSLEDFRKQTEEMLKTASTLLDEIKTGRKTEPEENKVVENLESPAKVPVVSCPICLESLASRAASVTMCGHVFCKECIMHTAKAMKKCPTCRKSISVKKIHPIYF